MRFGIVTWVVLTGLLGLAGAVAAQDINFGDDAGRYARDGECDDKRFIGPGMTATILLEGDIGHDATDCRRAFEAGTIWIRKVVTDRVTYDGINFGDDASRFANDNECDDKRFTGDGMTSTPLLTDDIRHDASDCLRAYMDGRIRLK